MAAMATVTTLAAASPSVPSASRLGAQLCDSLTRAVDVAGPAGTPVFVASYRPGEREESLPPPLASSAFTYDNALAAIALVACNRVDGARRIAEAITLAVHHDRRFPDGRIRNAYRAGPVSDGPAALPGWWDDAAKVWAEDAYQDGSTTGNAAWAALALLTVFEADRKPEYLVAARRLLDWVDEHASAPHRAGFSGGTFGFDPAQTSIRWSSTEHNIDVAAAADWLFRVTEQRRYAAIAERARRFVGDAYDPERGFFRIGTRPDGTMSTDRIVLDVQLWPWMAMADAPPRWRRALAFAEQHLAVDGGFDFDDDRDGVWVEGTAQAALAYRVAGQPDRAARLLGGFERDRATGGLLNATRVEKLSTGLSVGPEDTRADFFYFRRPHLGATAWAALAAQGWNPFAGRRVH